MNSELEKFLPDNALHSCLELLENLAVQIRIVNIRATRHGDYKRLPDGRHRITLNATPNPYRFLVTFIHEIAHLQAFESYGRHIKPHGAEWKRTFQHLMLPFLRPEVFPNDLLGEMARHFRNPKASSSTDFKLAMALKAYDPPSDSKLVLEIPTGAMFRLQNGRKFRRGEKRVKRIECIELASGRLYLFQPNAEVYLINN